VGIPLIKTMLIQSIMPFMNLGGMIFLYYFRKYLDSGKTLNDKIPQTKKVTISQFIEQHAGQEG
jgi:hypothetical protein